MPVINFTITIGEGALGAIEAFRLRQKNADDTLTYPTLADFLRSKLRENLRPVIMDAPPPQIAVEQRKIDAAQEAIKVLLENA